MSRDDHNVQVVDLLELQGFSVCGTCHAGNLVVHSEEVLEGDGCKGLAVSLDPYIFLGLYGLMEAFAISSSRKDSSCKFIYNLDFSILYDVIYIGFIEILGPYSLGNIVDHLEVFAVI